MKKIATTFALLAICATSAFAANTVRISQVYGGGGNTGATYTYDYVELFNSSGTAVDISGWSLQYGSATGTTALGSCVNCQTIFPAGSSIPACGYFLVQLAAGATPSSDLPVPADLVIPQATANNLGGTNGKIALLNGTTQTLCAPVNAWVDLVGYGTANCFEGVAAGALSNSTMAIRGGGGLTDTDNNSADFTVGNGVPHNSHSPANTQCLATPVSSHSWGQVKSLYR